MAKRAAGTKKLFILDTNVLLYDHTCIYNFEEHDIVIPIVVLEELDNFKKGSDLINFEAREFIRELDTLSSEAPLKHGLPLGEGRGRLFVEVGMPRSGLIDNAFARDKPDHRILAVADDLRRREPERSVCIVSKDITLRMKAKSLGIPAADYETGKVKHVERLYSSVRLHDNFNPELISRFYEPPHELPAAEVHLPAPPIANQYAILKNHSQSALTRFDAQRQVFERLTRPRAYGIEPRNAEQTFSLDALLRPEIQLVALTGKAGTGKTLLALAAALEQRRRYRQIYLARPVVPMGNRDIGYLPGDIKSKLDPYMQPLWDNLSVIRHRFGQDSAEGQMLADMVAKEKLMIAPLAYIRGRSLEGVFFITDEAQNLTPHEVKTIITRAGEGTKVVFTGDLYQIDTPYLDSESNGLAHLVDRMQGQELFAHVHLVKGERSPLAELATDML